MTGRERILAAMDGTGSDRPAVAPFVHISTVKAWKKDPDADVLTGTAEFCRHFGFDLIHRNFNVRHNDFQPGDGWTVTKPFEPLIKGGKIYGRGTADDKGPAVAALYAMRAVRELNIPLKKNVRLILGTDEDVIYHDIEDEIEYMKLDLEPEYKHTRLMYFDLIVLKPVG